MSLLSETKKTVVQSANVVDSQVRLGLPTYVVGGVNYEKIVCSSVSPRLRTNPNIVLLNAITGKPIVVTNKLIVNVIMEGGPELVATDPNTFINLNQQTDLTGGSSSQITSDIVSVINAKYFDEPSDVYISGIDNVEYPYLSIGVGGAGDVTAGSVTVTLLLATFAN
jgi:hypothetical protein